MEEPGIEPGGQQLDDRGRNHSTPPSKRAHGGYAPNAGVDTLHRSIPIPGDRDGPRFEGRSTMGHCIIESDKRFWQAYLVARQTKTTTDLVTHYIQSWSPTTSGLHGVKMSQIKSGDNDGDDDADLSKEFEKTVRRLIETPPKPRKAKEPRPNRDSSKEDSE